MLKAFQARFQQCMTKNYHIYKLGLEKAEESEINWQNPSDHRKTREFKKKIYFSFTDYAKDFDTVDHNKLGKILKEIGIPDHLTCLLKTCMQVKKQQLERDMGQWTGSKLWKNNIKVVYCHPSYLIYMQSTSYEILGWMSSKLESRILGEISTISDIQMISF